MAAVLNVKAVTAAKPDPHKRREIPDGALPGLHLVVQPNGKKSWALRYRRNGKTAKLTIGPMLAERDGAALSLQLGAPHTLAEARVAGRAALQALGEGKDPARQKAARKAYEKTERDLVSRQATDFVERYCKRNHNRAWPEVERQFRVEILPHWGDRRVQDIAKRDVLDLLDGIVDRGSPITANRVFATLRRFFNWLTERDVLIASPCAGLKPPTAEQSRDRVLNDDEMRLFWQATEQFGYPFGPLWRLLLLTGQRRGEVTGMNRNELLLDGDKPLWSIPAARTKNGIAHAVPLSAPAADIIRALPRMGRSPLCFTTTGQNPVSGHTPPKLRLDKVMREIARTNGNDADIPGWTLHDLRRTAASGMARLGINLPVIEKLLNHTSGSFAGIVGVYQHHDFADEKRRALNQWANFVTSLVADAPSNVVSLRA